MFINHTLRKNILFNYKRLNYFRKYKFSSTAAFSHTVKHDIGNTISGYSIKQVEDVPELNLTAVQLEHRETGAQHLHLACDDPNNLFCVAFRTPPQNSTGVPHILEHLALCGSKRFPCRDPFMNMLTRSLATFMNAFTGSDYTMYVYSSQNAKDFQNLLAVYLDAAFYPSLQENNFRQEGWRLEHEDVNDKNSPIIFKGVVFNEMKGVFSDPNQYYGEHLQNYLFPDNTYSYVSGGDPLAIPNLTWEELKQFHAKHYHPTNSRFVTYGNMPLEAHLENIENYVLNHFQKISIENNVPCQEAWTNPREIHIHNRFDPMAAVPEKQTIISNSYVLERITDTYENFSLSILGSLLVDGPNSPFYQRLLESGIGPDYSPYTGFDGHLKQSIFSVGLREIAEKDVGHVKEVIESTFTEVVKNGFPDEQIKAVLHSVELAMKHRTANFGLNCAMGVNSMWNHSGDPVLAFKVNDHVKWFMKQLRDNPHYLQDKIVQYFKNNNHKLTLIMSPVQNFEAEQQAKEKQLLESKLAKLTDAEKLKLYHEGIELLKHQQVVDTSSLPSLQIEDVSKTIEKIPIEFTTVCGVNVQLCEQHTNEVVYFKAMADAESVPDDYIMLLPLFSSIVTQMGAGSRNYKELDQEIQLKTGGFDASVHISEHPTKQDHFNKGVLFSSYCLEKNINDMFSLWKDIFCRLCLEDKDRLSQLIKLHATDLAQSIPSQGHKYAMRKASSCLNSFGSVKEKTSGLSQISYMKMLAEMESHDEVLEKLKNIAKLLLQQNSLKCAINASTSAMPQALNGLESFLNSVPVTSLTSNSQKTNISPDPNKKTHFILPLSVNYLGQCILTVPYGHQDYASLKVAAKLMSSKYLHREIREKGGAYGGGAAIGKGGHFLFYSYRDPNLSKTLSSFSSGIQWLLEANYSDQDINEAKLGVFGEVDAPIPPGSKGALLFQEGISDEMKQELRQNVFNCKREDLIYVTQKYLKNPLETGIALIGPENQVTNSDSSTWSLYSE